MFELMEQGYDVVYGQRLTRAKETRLKLMTARWFYRILSTLSEVSIPRDVGDFRLMSRRTVDRLLAMPERDRFIRGMVAWLGGRQIAIRYHRDPRFAGQTNYGFGKMLRLAVDGIVSFSSAPLRIASILALIGTFIGLLICSYTLLGFLFGDVNRGWTSQALITTFFGVGQFACLSVIGAYLGRMYSQVKGRPLFLIDEIMTGVDMADSHDTPFASANSVEEKTWKSISTSSPRNTPPYMPKTHG
jgi:dolichol-phosphate mannosyltransferase